MADPRGPRRQTVLGEIHGGPLRKVGPYADIVELDLATKEERVVARAEESPVEILASGTELYWLDIGDDGLRRVLKEGGEVTTIARVPAAGWFALSTDSIYVAGFTGLTVVPRDGGAPELLLRAGSFRAPNVAGQKDAVSAVSLVGNDLLWTVPTSATTSALVRATRWARD